MKLLLDANISWKLIKTLAPVFGECAHVDLIDLKIPTEDEQIWNYALENEYTIITKDNDFFELLELKGFPPKVVLIKTGNNSSEVLANLLLDSKSEIEELENNEYGLLEIYGPINNPALKG
jgi:predicted nuclease of predicted toxin-antitoxin system